MEAMGVEEPESHSDGKAGGAPHNGGKLMVLRWSWFRWHIPSCNTTFFP